MVYLYAALGAVMMAGIMAIFEMGLSLTGQSSLPTPSDVYVGTQDAKDLDKALLKLLANPADLERDLIGQDLCDAINLADPRQYSFAPIASREDPWDEGCQFQTFYAVPGQKIVYHKILIKPSAQINSSHLPYELYSCTSTRDGYQCSFEPREVGS